MAAGRIVIEGWQPALDINGNPYAGARFTFYLNGTSTLATVYSDVALTVELTNPVIADSAGRLPSIYAATTAVFSVRVATTTDAQLDLRNDVRPLGAGPAAAAVDDGEGVILLTDMFGGTPSNLAISVMEQTRAEVIAGLNLPMLIKLASVRGRESLEACVAHAQEAGRKYISVASWVLAGEK